MTGLPAAPACLPAVFARARGAGAPVTGEDAGLSGEDEHVGSRYVHGHE